MIRYYTYLLQLDCHLVAVVGKLEKNRTETAIYKKEITPNNTQTHNTQNRKQT
jgi:hypothetical protein